MLLACVMLAGAQEEESRPVNRGLLKRGQLAKGKQTTTTTTAAPEEDEEYEEEEYPTGEAGEPSTEATTSTTEGKKLIGSAVRPRASNAHLLEILKKKRAEAAEAKLHGTTTTTSSPEQDSLDPNKNFTTKSKKRFNNAPVTREVSNNDAPAAPKPSRGRFNRPATRSVQEPEVVANEPAPASRSSRPFRRSGN